MAGKLCGRSNYTLGLDETATPTRSGVALDNTGERQSRDNWNDESRQSIGTRIREEESKIRQQDREQEL